MVGDRLDTDIAFGKSGGVGTLLVLSGKSFQVSSNTRGTDASRKVLPRLQILPPRTPRTTS